MLKRRVIANLIATVHLGWAIVTTGAAILAFFIPRVRLFSLGILAITIIAQKIFYGCPLTIWENRVRATIDKSFNLGEAFMYRMFKLKISSRIQKILPVGLFAVVLFFAA